MDILAKKLYKIMIKKNLKKTKVSLAFLCQLAGFDFLSFNQLQKLQEQLDSHNIYLKQMSANEFCLFYVGKLSDVKPLKLSQYEFSDFSKLARSDFDNININSSADNASATTTPLLLDEVMLNLWNYLVANAGAKPELNVVTYKSVSIYLGLSNHLKARPFLADIEQFCHFNNIPNLTWLVVNGTSTLPNKKVEWREWFEEIKLIRAFDYSNFEDEFLKSYEIVAP